MKHLLPPLAVLLLLTTPVATQDLRKGIEAYKRGDYLAALREWLPLAENGDAAAQFDVSFMYYKGRGVAQDDVLAYMWCDLAASNGHKYAEENCELIAKGMLPADISRAQRLARDWYEKQHK